MTLVRDNILVPTKDAPELAYVIESTEERYVPDVFFMEQDKYKNEIKKIGRPLPVEYLLLDVAVSAPIEPLSTFSVLEGDRKHFPVENRLLESSLQVNVLSLLKSYMKVYRANCMFFCSGFQLICSVHVTVQVSRIPHSNFRYSCSGIHGN